VSAWFILSGAAGQELSRHRTLVRAVEAQEALAESSVITRSDSSEPVDQVDVEIAAEIRRRPAGWVVRNYWESREVGRFDSWTAADACLQAEIARSPAARINCGIEAVTEGSR